MAQLILPDVMGGLSDNEVSLLLLTAYLHDIGMTPAWGKVAAHRAYLMSARVEGFRGDELDRFQLWLAERKGLSFSPPVTSVEEMEELITHYCRARHNDWSAEWISTELANVLPIPYPGWIEDLILICKSHHEGYDTLSSTRFEPRNLGTQGVVHRRYLACILRVSDVLENDPERTPDVILRHRTITGSSDIFWRKDHFITQQVEGDHLLVSSTPPKAVIYRAVEETIDSIEAELQLCHRLSREHPFSIHPLTGEKNLPHEWNIEPSVVRKVQEQPGTFEYIPGSFRPNTKKVLSLLAGQHLYGDELAAVRELLQNAFDSVKEQIARTQIKRKRFDETFRTLLQHEHVIQIELSKSGERYRLSCRDTGVGMSKRTIKDRLLVSGESSSAELVALQLEFRKNNLRLERSGQFGIGVLSYFMIADHLIFRTRPSQEADVQDSRGWEFETWGIGSFGELRPVEGLFNGTEVLMDLLESLFPNRGDQTARLFFDKLRHFIRGVVAAAPCQVQLTSTIKGCEPMQLAPGWVEGADHATSALHARIKSAFPEDPGLGDPSLSTDELQYTQSLAEVRRVFDQRFEASVRWWGPFTGDLPNGLGRYSISLPYFDLDGEVSLAYLFILKGTERTESRIYISSGTYGLLPASVSAFSVAGFKVAFRELRVGESWVAKIDILDDSQVTVQIDRLSATITNDALAVVSEFLAVECAKAEEAFLKRHSSSTYHSLNSRLLGRSSYSTRHKAWAAFNGVELTWRAVTLPCAVVQNEATNPLWTRKAISNPDSPPPSSKISGTQWSARGVPTMRSPQLKLWRPQYANIEVAPFDSAPDLLLQGPGAVGIFPVMTWSTESGSFPLRPIQKVAFPPEWRTAVALLADLNDKRCLLLNPEHSAIGSVDLSNLRLTEHVLSLPRYSIERKLVFPTGQQREEIRSSGSAALDWLLASLISGKTGEIWPALIEQAPTFLESVWGELGVPSAEPIFFFNPGEFSPLMEKCAIFKATPTKAQRLYSMPEMLIVKSPDWLLTEDQVLES